MTKTIFRKVVDEKEKSIIRESAINSLIIAKKPNKSLDLFALKCTAFKNNYFYFESQTKIENLPKEGTLCGLLLINSEKYFFSADYRFEKEQILIKFDFDFYHLQRRDDFRVHIIDVLKGRVKVSGVEYKLLDLSAGGCKFEIEKTVPALKAEDIVDGEISIRDYAPLKFKGQIKHINEKQFGVQFLEQAEKDKNKVSALVMEIYRNVFLSQKRP